MKTQDSNDIAVLIDADNTQPGKLEFVLREISTRGRIVVKRAYGNWMKPALGPWGSIMKVVEGFLSVMGCSPCCWSSTLTSNVCVYVLFLSSVQLHLNLLSSASALYMQVPEP